MLKDSLFALEVQAPFSREILNGRKTIETRAYALPEYLLQQPILLLETVTGSVGVSSLADVMQLPAEGIQVLGFVVFSESFEYISSDDWESDRDAHLVPLESGYNFKPGSDEGRRWGWKIERIIPINETIEIAFDIKRSYRSLFVCGPKESLASVLLPLGDWA
jgi:hypothetical protein